MSKSSEMTNAIIALLVVLLIIQLYRMYQESRIRKENFEWCTACTSIGWPCIQYPC